MKVFNSIVLPILGFIGVYLLGFAFLHVIKEKNKLQQEIKELKNKLENLQ